MACNCHDCEVVSCTRGYLKQQEAVSLIIGLTCGFMLACAVLPLIQMWAR